MLLGREAVRIRVLPTSSQWFGMTFAEDLPGVRKAFAEMAEQGVYSNPLFSVNEY